MLIHDPAARPRRLGALALTWHQARRRASDPAHTLARILEGLCEGVAVGIDIHPMSDGHFAVLHGPMLDNETTGSGPIIRTRATDLTALCRRAPDGTALAEPPLTLAALVEAVAFEADGLLRINLRCGDESLRPGHEVGFARALRPLAGKCILSGRDVMALRRLGDAQPDLRLGFSLADETAEWLHRSGDAEAFAARVIEAIPEAGLVCLSGSTILALEDEDIGLVAAFKARGWQVQAQVDESGSPDAGLWEALRLVSLGVDGIITGDANGLLAALAGQHPPAARRGQPRSLRPEPVADDSPAGPDWEAPQPRTAA